MVFLVWIPVSFLSGQLQVVAGRKGEVAQWGEARTVLVAPPSEVGEEDVAECITVFDEPVSRSRVERGGYQLSREVES